jgi:predicted  nucleic acid-binding Zn-ribbon protein
MNMKHSSPLSWPGGGRDERVSETKGMERLLELQEIDMAIDRLESRRRDLEAGDEVAEARRRAEAAEERLG